MGYHHNGMGAVGDRVTSPMPPNDGAMIAVFTSAVQAQLLRNGRDLGPTGVDGDWGTKTGTAFAAAEASIPFANRFGRSFAYRVAADGRSVNLTGDLWNAIQRLPTIARTRTPAPQPPSGDGGTTIGPANDPPILPDSGGGSNLLPWIIGGIVLAGIGAYLCFTPRKKARPVAANRRRRAKRRVRRNSVARPGEKPPVRRLYTGPTIVKEVAKIFRGIPGVSHVIAGTEHVLFDFDGTPDEFEDAATQGHGENYQLVRSLLRGQRWN